MNEDDANLMRRLQKGLHIYEKWKFYSLMAFALGGILMTQHLEIRYFLWTAISAGLLIGIFLRVRNRRSESAAPLSLVGKLPKQR